MAFFKDLTKGFRGVGRVLRAAVGKGPGFKAGLGDIGSAAQAAAPALAFVPGVGWVPAAAIGAAGGALERGGRRGFTAENIARGAVTGGARGAAGEAAQQFVAKPAWRELRGVAGKLGLGGVPAAAPGPAPLPAGSAGAQMFPNLAEGAGAATPTAGGGMDLTKAYLISQGLGTAAQTYGAGKMGEAEAAEAEFARRQWEEPRRLRSEMAPYLMDYLISQGLVSAPATRLSA